MTYTKYQVVCFYGTYFSNNSEYSSLEEAWAVYKNHKTYCLSDGGYIVRIVYKKRPLLKDIAIKKKIIINWAAD